MEKNYDEVLEKCLLFNDIEHKNLSAMLGCLGAKVEKFSKNQTILTEGEPARRIGIVLSGAAQIIRVDYYGNRSIVASMEPAQLFGESFACAGVKTMPVSVVASEDAEVMLIDCARIIRSCSNACVFHNQMIFNLMKVVATKNLVFNQKLEVTSRRTTREKLMTYLLLQAKLQNKSSFTIPYDRQELADFLEVDRSGLSAEISRMRREGLIACKRSTFTLLNKKEESQS